MLSEVVPLKLEFRHLEPGGLETVVEEVIQ